MMSMTIQRKSTANKEGADVVQSPMFNHLQVIEPNSGLVVDSQNKLSHSLRNVKIQERDSEH